MRTLSVRPVNPDDQNGPADLDNTVVDNLESLRQRITQRLRFQIGTWELDARKGTDSVLGFEYTPDLAAAVLSGAIRDEGADEVTGPPSVETRLDRDRVLHYEATVPTIYGDMTVRGTAI